MKNRVLSVAVYLLLGSSIAFSQAKGTIGSSKPGSGSHKTGDQRNSYSGCDSTTPTIVADGSLVQDSVGAGVVAVYQVALEAGHSYSAEIWNPFGQDHTDSNGRPFLALAYAPPSCIYAPFTDVSAVDPALNSGFSARISWTQPADGQGAIGVENFDSFNSYSYNLRVTDTTLHSSRWSTYSGFGTQYAFVNTTSSDISSVLTVTESTGPQHTLNITVPAHGEAFKIVVASGGDINVGANKFGFADLAFIGPPGAITADAVLINSSATVIVPVAFAPRNSQH